MKAVIYKYNTEKKIYATIEQNYTCQVELDYFLVKAGVSVSQNGIYDVTTQTMNYHIFDQQPKYQYNDMTGMYDTVDGSNEMSLWELSKHMDGASVPIPTKDLTCPHQWARYDGFNESYWFCKTCNLKADLDKLP